MQLLLLDAIDISWIIDILTFVLNIVKDFLPLFSGLIPERSLLLQVEIPQLAAARQESCMHMPQTLMATISSDLVDVQISEAHQPHVYQNK